MSLTIIPKIWGSWDFRVYDGTTEIASIDVSWGGTNGTLTVQGIDHRVYREGLIGGDFGIERGGATLARASKPSAFLNMFSLSYGGRQYTLRKRSIWTRAFDLLE